MQEVTRDAIVSITLFAAVFGMVYVYLMTRHRERMTILDKNMTYPFPTNDFGTFSLKVGMFLTGVGLGFLAGCLLEAMGMSHDLSYVSMVSIFGGLSLIASYFVIKKQ